MQGIVSKCLVTEYEGTFTSSRNGRGEEAQGAQLVFLTDS